MVERVLKSMNGMILVTLFLVSFVFFLYFTFPYDVLKEAITVEFNKSSELNLRIGKLGPDFPLGIDAEDIVLSTDQGQKDLKIHRASASFSILRLLVGQAYFDIELESKNGGTLDLTLGFGVFDLFSQEMPIPSLSIDADKFSIDGFLGFALSSAGASPGMNPMFAPLLNQISLMGNLSGVAELDIDLTEPTSSTGDLNLSLSDGKLMVETPGLEIAPQKISKFLIRAKMDKGSLKIDKQSGIVSQELKLDINGNIDFRKNIMTSPLNVNVAIKLEDSLKENFGLLVDMGMQGKDGQGKMQLTGTLLNPIYGYF